jgi:hypothetical protein
MDTYPVAMGAKQEVDGEVTALDDQAGHVDGEHEDESCYSPGSIERP